MTADQYTEISARSLLKAQTIERRPDFSKNLKAQLLSEKLRGHSVSQKSHAQQMKLFGHLKIYHYISKY